VKAPSVLLVPIPLVKKAGLALVPDEAMVSMQHNVLIRLHHIVPWNKVDFLVASPYKSPIRGSDSEH
jgi:hypothetical protein